MVGCLPRYRASKPGVVGSSPTGHVGFPRESEGAAGSTEANKGPIGPHSVPAASGAELRARAGVHDFAASLAAGETHERTLDAAFEARGWVVTPATRDEQRDGIDRWMERDGKRVSVEFKADIKADETGNYALELVSSIADTDGPVKAGWALKPGADWLVLFRPVAALAHAFRSSTLRDAARQWLASRAYRVAPVRNTSWTSLVLLVPCASVERLAAQRLEVSP